jgi:hypothetical protein
MPTMARSFHLVVLRTKPAQLSLPTQQVNRAQSRKIRRQNWMSMSTCRQRKHT